ncbi:unnamed protein product, partial [marine sediment metagenome]
VSKKNLKSELKSKNKKRNSYLVSRESYLEI